MQAYEHVDFVESRVNRKQRGNLDASDSPTSFDPRRHRPWSDHARGYGVQAMLFAVEVDGLAQGPSASRHKEFPSRGLVDQALQAASGLVDGCAKVRTLQFLLRRGGLQLAGAGRGLSRRLKLAECEAG